MGELSGLKSDLVQVVRLAWAEQTEDVRLFAAQLVRKYRETIRENLSNDDLDEKVKQKWLWFARLFNSNNKIFSSLTSQEPPPIIDIDEALPTIIVCELLESRTRSDGLDFTISGIRFKMNPKR